MGSEGLNVALERWECVFSADTGAFYINLLIVISFVGCQMELHRFGDLCYLAYARVSNCRVWEKGEAARRKYKDKIGNRNGDRLSLADDYVWTVLYFTICMFFCLTCPVITPAFLIFIVSKYIVVMQNYRCFYTAHHDQPELLTTAAKLTIFASLFPQLNFTLLMLIKQGMQHSYSGVAPITSFLLFVNLVSWAIAHKLNNWNCFTIRSLGTQKTIRSRGG